MITIVNMKNTIKRQIILVSMILLGTISMTAQDITFTFANAQITNDGSDDYYDVDVMLQSTTDFKLGSGQLYLTYNTAAFGDNISANNNLTYTQPTGSILAEHYSTFPAYKSFIQNDNTTSRVSLAFQQGLSEGVITTNNVITTPKVLLHVRIKFIDVTQDPMVAFETGSVYLDQFYTACGSTTNTGLADCSVAPGIQLLNDSFDSSNAADTTAPVIVLDGDDPQEIIIGSGYTELGASTDDGSDITIDSSEFIDAIGSYTIYYDATDIVGNAATQVRRTVNVVAVLSTPNHTIEDLSIYPNPTRGKVFITDEVNKVIIYNISGQQVFVSNEEELDISALETGIYFAHIFTNKGSDIIKIVKE